MAISDTEDRSSVSYSKLVHMHVRSFQPAPATPNSEAHYLAEQSVCTVVARRLLPILITNLRSEAHHLAEQSVSTIVARRLQPILRTNLQRDSAYLAPLVVQLCILHSTGFAG